MPQRPHWSDLTRRPRPYLLYRVPPNPGCPALLEMQLAETSLLCALFSDLPVHGMLCGLVPSFALA